MSGIVIAYGLYRHGKAASLDPRRTAASRSRWSRSLPVSYALFSGLLGTQSVLFCKALSTLLRTTLHGQSQLGSWFFWTCLLALVLTALFWVSMLNKGLRLFPAVVIVPTMQISWTLFSIVSGMVYYQEYRTFSTLSACMFALGVGVVFVGVWLLTPAVVSSSSAASSAEKVEEEREAAAASAGEGGDTNGHPSSAAATVAAAVVPVIEDDGISVEPLVASDDEEEAGVRSDDDHGERRRRRNREKEAAPSSTAAATAASSLDGGGGRGGASRAVVPPLELGGPVSPDPLDGDTVAAAGEGTPRSPLANEHWRQKRAAAEAASASAASVSGQSPLSQQRKTQQQALSPASSAASFKSAPAGSSPSKWEDIALGLDPGQGSGSAGGGSGAAGPSTSATATTQQQQQRQNSSSSRVRRRTCNSLMDDLADDFSVDAPSSLRPLLGLGPPGGAMAAVSLFSVPYEGLLPRGGGGAVGGGGNATAALHEDPPLSASSPSPAVTLSRLSPKQQRDRRQQQEQQQQTHPGRWSAPGDVESAGAAEQRSRIGSSSAAAAGAASSSSIPVVPLRRSDRITEGPEKGEEGVADGAPSSPPLSTRASAAASALARPVAAAAARVARRVAAATARVASPMSSSSDRPRPLSDGGDAREEDLEVLPPAAPKSVELPDVHKP